MADMCSKRAFSLSKEYYNVEKGNHEPGKQSKSKEIDRSEAEHMFYDVQADNWHCS